MPPVSMGIGLAPTGAIATKAVRRSLCLSRTLFESHLGWRQDLGLLSVRTHRWAVHGVHYRAVELVYNIQGWRKEIYWVVR